MDGVFCYVVLRVSLVSIVLPDNHPHQLSCYVSLCCVWCFQLRYILCRFFHPLVFFANEMGLVTPPSPTTCTANIVAPPEQPSCLPFFNRILLPSTDLLPDWVIGELFLSFPAISFFLVAILGDVYRGAEDGAYRRTFDPVVGKKREGH